MVHNKSTYILLTETRVTSNKGTTNNYCPGSMWHCAKFKILSPKNGEEASGTTCVSIIMANDAPQITHQPVLFNKKSCDSLIGNR